MVDVIAEGNDGQIVVQDNVAQMLQPHEARLNITWSGTNGDLPDPVPFDAAEARIKEWATEAVTNGSVPGITADEAVNFGDFIVDRFPATDDRPFNALFLRPKTPFGG